MGAGELMMVLLQGHFAAQALLAPSAYAGRVIKLAGDELTVSQMCAAYTKAQFVLLPFPFFVPSCELALILA